MKIESTGSPGNGKYAKLERKLLQQFAVENSLGDHLADEDKDPLAGAAYFEGTDTKLSYCTER
jgi:hypothetical protein